ncbi:PilZ domain-containing protein [Desulfoluna limicola]|nr:PilZ domain-containing protein [Desulfoluna limicola]
MEKRVKPKREMSLSEATSRLISHILKMGQGEIMELLDLVEKKNFEKKRKSPRFDYYGEAVYVVKGRAYTGFIKNISTEGVFIETPDITESGEKIILSFELPDGEHVRVSGTVVRGEANGFAVSFDRTIDGNLSRLKVPSTEPESPGQLKRRK